MKVPAGDRLSNAEILALIDLEAGEIPGWKPSEHFDEHSLISAYRDAQTGDAELLRLLTKDRLLAVLAMLGDELIENHYDTNRPLSASVEEIVGPGSDEPLASYLSMRMSILSEQAGTYDDPVKALSLYQMDSFLLGWLAHARFESDDA